MVSSTRSVPSAPLVYLIAGGTGAGKTTYARKLADEIGAIRFSIDDWMTTLFWMDSPDPMSFDWTMTRINRCEEQIWEAATQALDRGLPVILDLGFTKKAHRVKFKNLSEARGAEVTLYWVDVAAEERWRRVESRNAEKGETFAMDVPREMFDFMENEWEVPEGEESFKRVRG